jgi:glycosyltransferase involved in cell wall biosynthesis
MIDVLLPFYGDPELMRLAVRSVVEQTHPNFRLVVVDDCFPDEAIPDWFEALDDDRVEYHRNEHNLGANRNYMKALHLARADHVVVMGADDLMLPTYLEVVTDTIARYPEAAVVQCGVEVIDAAGDSTRPLVDRVKSRLSLARSAPGLHGGEELLISLLRGNWTYFPSLCWRRDRVLAVGFRPDFHVVQDLGLLIDVLQQPEAAMAVTPEVVFQYRRHSGSDSAVKTLSGSRFDEERHYFNQIADELDSCGLHRAARAARAHLTSRLHAAALLPIAARERNGTALKHLLRHATR